MTVDFSDLKSLCLSQDFDAGDVLKQLQVQVRKPGKEEFIRVHPDLLIPGPVGMYEDKTENTFYFVVPPMMHHMEGHAFKVVLRLAITSDGHWFGWPTRLADEDGKMNDYWRTAHHAAELAQEQWLRVSPNKRMGHYDIIIAANQNRPPPLWPKESFEKVVETAFRDKIITSEDHAVIKRLRGET